MDEDSKKVLSDFQNLENRFRREILHKISNTTPSKLSNDQFHSLINSARSIERDWSKLIKKFKKIVK
ncbi:MAG: hypothetical protein HeimC3_28300 [Candidatus Heimdallarchaeota archaeon LC_3]|nr:MAG: hypothetical protein HeimC3_28300 [Candidatus Heimdallarchaeota archaeon LC_3]